MPCIELDLLIAFVNSIDELHEKADEIFLRVSRKELQDIYAASSAYMEYELVHRAKGVPDGEVMEDLDAFSRYPNLGEATLKVETLIKAAELRSGYGLTCFDSIHAATAILHDGVIISSDRAYDNVPGLRRLSPQHI